MNRSEAASRDAMSVDFVIQLANLLSSALDIQISPASDYQSFRSVKADAKRQGIGQIIGEYIDGSTFQVRLEILSTPHEIKLPANDFISLLSELGEKAKIIVPADKPDRGTYLWLGLGVEAKPLSMTRCIMINSELTKIDAFARELQEHIPEGKEYQHLVELYRQVDNLLKPVFPMQMEGRMLDPVWREWLDECLDYVHANLPIALVSEYPLQLNYCLALLASELESRDLSLGRLSVPSINARNLSELGLKAPSIVVIPSAAISIGSNIYEISNEMSNVMTLIRDGGLRFIFMGSFAEHQSAFHGGQGNTPSPLLPVICNLPPEGDMEAVLRFSVDDAAYRSHGLSRREKNRLVTRLQEQMSGMDHDRQMQMLPLLLNRNLNLTAEADQQRSGAFIRRISILSETFSGLEPKPGNQRSASVQEHLTRVLTDPGLTGFFKSHLVAQDEALEQFCAKLAEEVLTRPLYQPLRLCLQGTPATGKSESALLLAQRLNVPFMNIDAASIPDFYTASAQLLGSGRGIVGSNRAGRLEEAARHHQAVVIEISDLDHAAPNVRAALADLFLQVLSNGQAQSATGTLFSCANLIMIFTINLPEGKDELLRKPGVGFNNNPSEADIRNGVVKEVKQMFSSAFLSRIGNPILYNSLHGPALAYIAARAMEQAVITAALRMGESIGDVVVEHDAARIVVERLANMNAFGARLICEQARHSVAQAYLEYRANAQDAAGRRLIVSGFLPDTITISIEEEQ
jgi:hypothetical protein